MAPPVDRLRGLPSSCDSSFLPSVHESVSDTSLTMIGQELSPRSSTNRPQQSEQGQRSQDQDQRPECSATSSIIQDPASRLSTSRDAHGLEASHSSSSSPAALPEVASRPRGLLPKGDRQTRSQVSMTSSAEDALSSSRSTTASRSVETASSSSSGAPSRPAAAASAPTPSSAAVPPSASSKETLFGSSTRSAGQACAASPRPLSAPPEVSDLSEHGLDELASDFLASDPNLDELQTVLPSQPS